MQFNKFKLSAIALAVAGMPTLANAALYSVSPLSTASNASSAAATAISPNGAEVGIEVLRGPVGLNYSQELPYMVDVEHFINSQDDLWDYCDDYLNYSTCDTWANERWFGLKDDGAVCNSEDYDAGVCSGGLKEESLAWTDGFKSNSAAFLNNTSTPVNPFGDGVTGDKPGGSAVSDSTNVVINAITDTGVAVGASSSPYYDNGTYNARAFVRRGFNGDTELLPPADATGVIPAIGQTNANGAIDIDGTRTIVFGSSSTHLMAEPGNDNKVPEDVPLGSLNTCTSTVDYSNRACQYMQFANQASIWVSDYSQNPNNARPIDSFANGATDDDDTAQASIRAAAIVDGDAAPTLVGFSTFDDRRFYGRAVAYTPKATTPEAFAACIDALETDVATRCWDRALIPGLNIRQSGDIVYRYTEANDINSKGWIVGTAKSARLRNGAYAETIFVSDGTNTQLIGRGNSPLFFEGYNATAAAINNNNELVGKVDVETSRDRQRRQRGYIYLHDNAPNLAEFDNQRGWLLDDLTNGSEGANQYRIAEAYDIAENGDIVASAFFCDGGYSSTAQNATCDGTEEIVAVKLTKIPGGDITPRTDEVTSIERSGGSVGLFGLGLLALGGLLRRKK